MSGGSAPFICAVVRAERRGVSPAAVLAGVERQTCPPGRVVTLGAGEGVGAALGEGVEWLWLLDGSAVPEPGALERLVAMIDPPGGLPAPVLLASKVVTSAGSLDPTSLPVSQVGDRDLAINSFEQRVLSLRVVRSGSLLVHARTLEEVATGWPRVDPFEDDLEWAARLLDGRPGLLVPTSVATRDAQGAAARRGAAEARRRLSLLFSDALDARDKPWFAFRFLEEGIARVRERVLGSG